jgi:hypothetical protein
MNLVDLALGTERKQQPRHFKRPNASGDCRSNCEGRSARAIRSSRRLNVLATAALLSLGSAHAVPVIWVGPTNGYWDVLGNWNPGLPGLTSDALLGAFNTEFRTGAVTVQSFVGTGRLTISGGTLAALAASSIGSFAFTGGVLDGTGAVTISGPSVWTGGQMASTTPGGSTTFNGALALSGNGVHDITSRTVNFAGTTTWDNAPGGGSQGVISHRLSCHPEQQRHLVGPKRGIARSDWQLLRWCAKHFQ